MWILELKGVGGGVGGGGGGGRGGVKRYFSVQNSGLWGPAISLQVD